MTIEPHQVPPHLSDRAAAIYGKCHDWRSSTLVEYIEAQLALTFVEGQMSGAKALADRLGCAHAPDRTHEL